MPGIGPKSIARTEIGAVAPALHVAGRKTWQPLETAHGLRRDKYILGAGPSQCRGVALFSPRDSTMNVLLVSPQTPTTFWSLNPSY